jgi:hypothetical protein
MSSLSLDGVVDHHEDVESRPRLGLVGVVEPPELLGKFKLSSGLSMHKNNDTKKYVVHSCGSLA